MNKEITKRESELADLFLNEFPKYEKDWIFKNSLYFFFKDFKIKNERVLFICEELEKRGLVKLNKDSKGKTWTLKMFKTESKEFLNNGGMTELWLKRNKLKYDFKMSKTKAISFPWLFAFSILSGIYSIIKIIEYIKSESKEKSVEESILQKGEVKEKSNTLVLNQAHIDSLHTPNNLESKKTLNK